MSAVPILREDEDTILARPEIWEPLRDARVLLTGGTGFVGKWLLCALVVAEQALALNLRVTVLTRDPAGFASSYPSLAEDRAVDLLHGDVRSLAWPTGKYSHVIHGAASSDATLYEHRPREAFEVIVEGSRRVFEMARRDGASRLLHLSSGAVYEPPPPETGFAEDSPLGPSAPLETSAYHAGKREAEAIMNDAEGRGMRVTIARLFAFVGPFLPLDKHFAVGNFIRDALAGRAISVQGDGSPVRSYLYGADMAVWLWVLLTDPSAEGEVFNVGSGRGMTIRTVAGVVADTAGFGCGVEVTGGTATGAGPVYLPDTRKARSLLAVDETVPFAEGVRRTMRWHRAPTMKARSR
jgi:nucleoside-diphosphate-sugar epimerase